jgi:hypothetical protein
VATAVREYELEILTGPREDVEARLNLFSGHERFPAALPVARISFYGPQVTLERDFVDRGEILELHLHTGMLSSVLDLLHSEEPLFVELTDQRGRLTTTAEDSLR